MNIDNLISQLVRIRDAAPNKGETPVVVYLAGSGIPLALVTEARLDINETGSALAVVNVPFGNHQTRVERHINGIDARAPIGTSPTHEGRTTYEILAAKRQASEMDEAECEEAEELLTRWKAGDTGHVVATCRRIDTEARAEERARIATRLLGLATGLDREISDLMAARAAGDFIEPSDITSRRAQAAAFRFEAEALSGEGIKS